MGELFNEHPINLPNLNFLNTTIKIFYLTPNIIGYFNLLLLWLRQNVPFLPSVLDFFRLREKIQYYSHNWDPQTWPYFFFFPSCPWCLLPGLCLVLFSVLGIIDGDYRVITLIFKNVVTYPSVCRIMHYSFTPIFTNHLYTNDANPSVISGFSSASSITSESNSRSFSNGSLVFGIDGNSQKLITSNDTRLTIAVADLIISEGLSFNISQKQKFK